MKAAKPRYRLDHEIVGPLDMDLWNDSHVILGLNTYHVFRKVSKQLPLCIPIELFSGLFQLSAIIACQLNLNEKICPSS